MKVVCSLCDTVHEIDPNTPLGKRFSNHPLKTFLCTRCHDRIADKTKRRLEKQYEAKEDKIATHLP